MISLALSYLSEFIDPGKFWPLAFFGLAYPFIILLNLMASFYWILKRNWRFVLPILVILLGFKEFKRNFSFHLNEEIHPAKNLKVMTYNVHSFRPLEKGNTDVRKEILNIIRNEDPDILGCQEFYTRPKGEYAVLDSLKKILHHPYYFYHKVDSNSFESRGMVIFSKYPIKNKASMGFDKSQTVNGTLMGDIITPSGPFRFYCVHLQSIDFRVIDYDYIIRVKQRIKPELKPTKRILEKLKVAFIKRAEQANEIHKSIQESQLPVLVMGDFNDTPVSYSYKTILGNLNSSFEAHGNGIGRTYNGSFPNFQIDHILCDSNFEICGYKIIEKKLSDHFPVRANLVLKGKP